MPAEFRSAEDFKAATGRSYGPTEWLLIEQSRIDQFADATGDHQWIHVDVEKAKAGPFGAPIAHGFLTLSLIPKFFETSVRILDTRMGVNYGLNKVRFTAPVPVGSRLRAHLKLLACEPIDNNGMQVTWLVTVEREGGDRPVCIAESVSRRYP